MPTNAIKNSGSKHAVPRKHVLLLTCMDLRLMDDVVTFMNDDNLENRYDHVVFAGAALGATGVPGKLDSNGQPYTRWADTFIDHLAAAVTLHDIQDVYILEHRNCGAYYKVFEVCRDFGDSAAELRAEDKCHLKYVKQLEEIIADWAKQNCHPLTTHKFIMDLRGNVEVLTAVKSTGKKKRK